MSALPTDGQRLGAEAATYMLVGLGDRRVAEPDSARQGHTKLLARHALDNPAMARRKAGG